jgi:hypothetical protein
MKSFKTFVEDVGGMAVAPTNNVGSGQIAGVGIGPKGEPGVPGKILRRKKISDFKKFTTESTFMGHKVFSVDSDTFHNARMGKRKYSRWDKASGGNPEISEYGRKSRKPIIVADKSGAMYFLRHPNKK